MSWRHGLAAGELDLDDPTAKAVLNALAFHANDFSGQCWPSLARLQRWTGLARRSVQNGLRRLEAEGLVRTRTGSNRKASVYQLVLPGVPVIDQLHGARLAPHGAADAPHGAADAPQSTMNDQGGDARAPLTPDWKPSVAAHAWAVAKGLTDAAIILDTERFVAVNLAAAKEIPNVEQAWRAWILRGIQLGERQNDRGGRVRGVQVDDGLDRLRGRAGQAPLHDGPRTASE